MPSADVFSMLGLFMRRNFLDAEAALGLREAIARAPAEAATVRSAGRDEVDRTSRSTDLAAVAPESFALVERRLAAVTSELAQHYGIALTGFQRPQFLIYRPGDFFLLHTDNATKPDSPEYLRARKVAGVLFVNGEGDPERSPSFRGGHLTLYGLFEQARSENVGLPLQAEPGLLATFPADTLHEVTPVEAGERYTVVTWFVDQ
jgi:SM-20-related protein